MKEEWQLVPDSFDFDPAMSSDWTFYKVNQRNIETLLPRLGHLIRDAEFDLEKFQLKGLNFRVKNNQERKISSSDGDIDGKGAVRKITFHSESDVYFCFY